MTFLARDESDQPADSAKNVPASMGGRLRFSDVPLARI
jgi:hypothetical protein